MGKLDPGTIRPKLRMTKIDKGRTVLLRAPRGVGGEADARSISGRLFPLALRQPAANAVVKTVAKLDESSLGAARDKVSGILRDKMQQQGGLIGGTIASGRKGPRSYINVPGVVGKGGGFEQSLRNVVHHEAFHRDVPVLGHSEFLAHAYGGLHQNKGKRNYGQAVRDMGHLVKTRPARAALELGLAYGTYKGARALARKVRGKQEEAEGNNKGKG